MKNQELLKVVKENVGEIVEYLNQYAEECDGEMGSSYQDAEGLFEAMDEEFMFNVFCAMFNELSSELEGVDDEIFDPTEFGEEDEDEDMFSEAYDEIINILFS